jgi:hypothetical protein
MSSSYRRQNWMPFWTLLKAKAGGLQSIFIFLFSIVSKTIDFRRLLVLCRSFLQSYLVLVGDVTDKVEFHRSLVIFTWRAKFAPSFGTKLRPRLKPRPPYIWDWGKENRLHQNIFLENRQAKFGLSFIIHLQGSILRPRLVQDYNQDYSKTKIQKVYMVVGYGKSPLSGPMQYGSIALLFTRRQCESTILTIPTVGIAISPYRRMQCALPRQRNPLPEMVPLRSVPHSQRQLFGLSHNCHPELDLLVKNPLKPSKLVTLSPATRAASTSKGSLMDGTKRKAVLDGLADDGSLKGMEARGLSINVNWIFNTEKSAILESMLAMTTPPPNPFCSVHIEKRWTSTKCHGPGRLPPTARRRTMVCYTSFTRSPSNSLQMPITESRRTPVRYLL